jgi:ABC-type transporter Mla MlaB component
MTGSNPPALHALASAARSVMQIDVSCVGLGRVDLEAAHALRTWLLACDARGCGVLLSHLPRLVLVYFQTLGLQELADISAGSF